MAISPVTGEAIQTFLDQGGRWRPELAGPILEVASLLMQALADVAQEDETARELLETLRLALQSYQATGEPGAVLQVTYALDNATTALEAMLPVEEYAATQGRIEDAFYVFQAGLDDDLIPSTPPAPQQPAPQQPAPQQPAPQQPAPFPAPQQPVPAPPPPESSQQETADTPLLTKGAIIGLAIGLPVLLIGVTVLSRFAKGDDEGRYAAEDVVVFKDGKRLTGAARTKFLASQGYS